MPDRHSDHIRRLRHLCSGDLEMALVALSYLAAAAQDSTLEDACDLVEGLSAGRSARLRDLQNERWTPPR